MAIVAAHLHSGLRQVLFNRLQGLESRTYWFGLHKAVIHGDGTLWEVMQEPWVLENALDRESLGRIGDQKLLN